MNDINKTRKDAINQAVTWMREAVRDVDEQFGTGYAQSHPELLAALVNAAALDQHFIGVHSLTTAVELLSNSVDDSNQ